MRSFVLTRYNDHSGVSGTGNVAEGVEFSDGTVAMRWMTHTRSTVIYDSIADVTRIHGHGGDTEVVWLPEPTPEALDHLVPYMLAGGLSVN